MTPSIYISLWFYYDIAKKNGTVDTVKNLHFTLILLWRHGNCRSYITISLFTFHSDSIMTDRGGGILGACGGIYISLWFYYDEMIKALKEFKETFTFHSDSIMTFKDIPFNHISRQFTFHSDSIMTKAEVEANREILQFTFHSDSIMTRLFDLSIIQKSHIYISLWFYYDIRIVLSTVRKTEFTFHSDSIMTRPLSA